MKQSEIKEMAIEDLKVKLEATRKSLSSLKLAHAISPLDNPIQLKSLRKTVARLATEITKRDQ
jgi:large subunit ribosomal protein L29